MHAQNYHMHLNLIFNQKLLSILIKYFLKVIYYNMLQVKVEHKG